MTKIVVNGGTGNATSSLPLLCPDFVQVQLRLDARFDEFRLDRGCLRFAHVVSLHEIIDDVG